MNQKQREFLLESIQRQFNSEERELAERKPSTPNLNNYLTAAILDGSFKLRPEASIKSAIHGRVIELGQGEVLVGHDDTWGRRRRDTEGQIEQIKLPADVLFELPEAYARAKSKYEADLEVWEAEVSRLSSAHEAMKIKVQLGSDSALQCLIDQADKLCSMSLTDSSKLMLEQTTTTKKLK